MKIRGCVREIAYTRMSRIMAILEAILRVLGMLRGRAKCDRCMQSCKILWGGRSSLDLSTRERIIWIG